MTNEIKTRRLIVTLPGVSGVEVDSMAMEIEEYIVESQNLGVVNATVRHALGETLPEGVVVRVASRGTMFRDLIEVRTPYDNGSSFFTQSDARQIAGALLAAADQLAEGTPS